MTQDTKMRLYKMGKGFAISFFAGGFVSVLMAVQHADFGSYTPLVVAMAGTLLNALHVATGQQDNEPNTTHL